MNIPQIDGVDTNAVNEPAFACLYLAVAITVIWVVLVIYARLPKDNNDTGLIELLVDNYGKTVNGVIFIITMVLCALAAYFNYCY